MEGTLQRKNVKKRKASLCEFEKHHRGVRRGKKKCLTILLERREGHRLSDKHWNRFNHNIGETSESQGGAQTGFSKYHPELNWETFTQDDIAKKRDKGHLAVQGTQPHGFWVGPLACGLFFLKWNCTGSHGYAIIVSHWNRARLKSSELRLLHKIWKMLLTRWSLFEAKLTFQVLCYSCNLYLRSRFT